MSNLLGSIISNVPVEYDEVFKSRCTKHGAQWLCGAWLLSPLFRHIVQVVSLAEAEKQVFHWENNI